MFSYLKSLVLVGLLSVVLVGCAKDPRPEDMERYKLLACLGAQQATVELVTRHPEVQQVMKRVASALQEFVQGMEGAALEGELVRVATEVLRNHPEVTAQQRVLILGVVRVAENELVMLLDRENPSDRIPEVVRAYADVILGCMVEVL